MEQLDTVRDWVAAFLVSEQWTNFEILTGRADEVAFADAPISFGGEEVDALIRDGNIETITIQISDQPQMGA